MVEASTEFEPSTTRAKDQEDSDDDFDTEDSTARENPFGAVIQKIRDLAVSLKLSSKKTQEFLDLQKSTRIGQRPLRLLRDVKTRWNSTTLMCLRARELKTTISAWVEKHSLQEQFSLVETDWEALDILLDITSPFLLFTNILSRLNDLTPGHTFTLLQVATISILQAATKKGQEKLEKYVQKLIEEDSFKVYGIATLLTPEAGTSVSSTFDTRFQFANYFEYLPSSASLRTRVQQEFIKRYLKVSDDLTKISITATGDAPSPPPYEVSVEEEDISDRDEELPSLSSSQQPKLSSQVSQLSNSPTPSVSQELPNFSELGGRKRKRLTRLDLVELSPDEDSD
nr:uncharacterized protein CTRU02_03103 [Colletotrichum truncatum]KAF6798061.1 hypothetical protein CTRU02_03103 [Colletotrichum truncatum]